MASKYENKETEFNGAMLQAIRLDREIQLSNNILSKYHLDYNPATLRILQSHIYNLYDEVFPKMSEKDKKKALEYQAKINDIKGITKRQKNADGEFDINVNVEKYEHKIHRTRAFRRFIIQIADRAGMLNPNKKKGASGWQ
jgi:hypothetical protein